MKISSIKILKTRKRWSDAYERFGQKWQARLMRYGRLSENLFLGYKVLKTMIDNVSRCFFWLNSCMTSWDILLGNSWLKTVQLICGNSVEVQDIKYLFDVNFSISYTSQNIRHFWKLRHLLFTFSIRCKILKTSLNMV